MEIISKFYLSLFTLKQASRRSWRLGQKNDIRVVFMAYEGTAQNVALKLIGSKVNAANSLEGRLSGDDDLSAINDDDSIQASLAKAILSGGASASNGKIEMTSIENFAGDRQWNEFELLFRKKRDLTLAQRAKVIEASVIEEIDMPVEENSEIVKEFDSLADMSVEKNDIPPFDMEDEIIEDKSGVEAFGSLLDYDGKITSTVVFYTGKGRNKKRVEVDTKDVSSMFTKEELSRGVQPSLF